MVTNNDDPAPVDNGSKLRRIVLENGVVCWTDDEPLKSDPAPVHDWRAPMGCDPREEGAICAKCGAFANSEANEPCPIDLDAVNNRRWHAELTAALSEIKGLRSDLLNARRRLLAQRKQLRQMTKGAIRANAIIAQLTAALGRAKGKLYNAARGAGNSDEVCTLSVSFITDALAAVRDAKGRE